MGMKIDRFTWGIVLGALALIAGAVITLAVPGDGGLQSDHYLNEDTPAAVVHDAFLATVRNEPDVALSHYSQEVLDEDKDAPFYERFGYNHSGRQARRLRILGVEINQEKDAAYVTLAIDYFHQGGLFESGASTRRRTISLVREDGAWKIDTPELFY